MSTHQKNLLIVFVKNLIVGNVKSRLALSIGYNNALDIYTDLVYKIHQTTLDIPFDKQVTYSSCIETRDIWEPEIFNKTLQRGNNIGERMNDAFEKAFEAGYENVDLIGSDIINLKSEILLNAFDQLQQSDTVLGPSMDGGYYLIGLKKPIKQFFKSKDWSTHKVFIQTLKDCCNLDLRVGLVQELADLDRIEDFQYLDMEDWKKYMNIIEKDGSKVTHPYMFRFIKKGA